MVDAVIDWERLRDEALLPLRARQSATFQPYDWDADDGRLAPPKTIPAADVIILEGVYAARPELADLVDVAVYLGVDPQVRAQPLRRAARTIRIGSDSGSAARPTTSALSVLPRASTSSWTIKIYATSAMPKSAGSPYMVEI